MWIARRDNLIVTSSGQETVVYSEDTQKIHYLNRLASVVWRSADGQTSPSAMLLLAQETVDATLSSEAIDQTLRQLVAANLVSGGGLAPVTQSRRRLLGGVAVGAAVISVTAPLASASASTTCASPPRPSLYVDMRRNAAGECNVRVLISGFCPNQSYEGTADVNQGGNTPVQWSYPVYITTDMYGDGQTVVTSFPEVTIYQFTVTMWGLVYRLGVSCPG